MLLYFKYSQNIVENCIFIDECQHPVHALPPLYTVILMLRLTYLEYYKLSYLERFCLVRDRLDVGLHYTTLKTK